MDEVEYELRVAMMFLKQAIDEVEKSLSPPVPLIFEKKRTRPWVDPIFKLHSPEVITKRAP